MMIDSQLQLFLEKELLTRWDKKIVFTPQMKLYKDFGLIGDDVDDFLINFTKEFNVKVSDDFNFYERFYPEGYSLGSVFNTIYDKLKNIVSQEKKHTPEPKDLSIGELQEAINTGILK